MAKQKGFTLIEGLLIVLILSVIGFAGYFVWSRNSSTEESQISPSQDSNQNITTKNEADLNYDDMFNEVITDLGIDRGDIKHFVFVGRDKAKYVDSDSRKFVYRSSNGWEVVYATREDPGCISVADIEEIKRPACYDESGRVPGAYEFDAEGYYVYIDW